MPCNGKHIRNKIEKISIYEIECIQAMSTYIVCSVHTGILLKKKNMKNNYDESLVKALIRDV